MISIQARPPRTGISGQSVSSREVITIGGTSRRLGGREPSLGDHELVPVQVPIKSHWRGGADVGAHHNTEVQVHHFVEIHSDSEGGGTKNCKIDEIV